MAPALTCAGAMIIWEMNGRRDLDPIQTRSRTVPLPYRGLFVRHSVVRRPDLRNLPLRPWQETHPAFAEKLLNFIIAEVIRHHETLANASVDGGSPPAGRD